jgi:hypothetical protein
MVKRDRDLTHFGEISLYPISVRSLLSESRPVFGLCLLLS